MKNKRKSGGGRKPKGPSKQNSAMITVRTPSDLRDEIERSARKKGWSLSQELIWRLRSSYAKQREEKRRSPAIRALCFLIGEIASSMGGFNQSEWHRSPFAFRAFRLAVDKLLEGLEPDGDVSNNPYEAGLEARKKEGGKMAAWMANIFQTPESLAAKLSEWQLASVFHPILRGERIYQRMREESPDHRWFADGMLDAIYSMADVRRDLDIPAREPLDPREFDLDKMMEEGFSS